MKIGDLVKTTEAPCYRDCSCWFCYNKSTRQGIVLEKLSCGLEGAGYWAVLFDAGEWRLYGSELEVISDG